MITFTLLAILGILLAIVLMNLFKKSPKPLPAPARPGEDLANLKVTDARAGDILGGSLGTRLMVGQRILDPYVGVRILHPQPHGAFV